MKTLMISAAFLGLMAAGGAQAETRTLWDGCAAKPVKNAAGEILYWNTADPTCVPDPGGQGGSPTPMPVILPPPPGPAPEAPPQKT
ncbi:MAG TPA: hypothetical protein PKD10_16085 [Paracoccaceae bacterium]|nr:hypothetical protein [Paracoccaceae bacterium]HMO73143.1 hypothetical protein [Paracoccaceae bacterium]